MASPTKNDILMAHMFLVKPDFLKEKISLHALVMTEAVQQPEFLQESPRVFEKISKKSKKEPPQQPKSLKEPSPPSESKILPSTASTLANSSSLPSTQLQSLAQKSQPKASSSIASQGPEMNSNQFSKELQWFVTNDVSKKGPLNTHFAVLEVLRAEESNLWMKSADQKMAINKEKLVDHFKKFIKDLEAYLKRSKPKDAPPQTSVPIESYPDIYQNQSNSSQQVSLSENEPEQEPEPEQAPVSKPAKASYPARPPEQSPNPYMSNNIYKTPYEDPNEGYMSNYAELQMPSRKPKKPQNSMTLTGPQGSEAGSSNQPVPPQLKSPSNRSTDQRFHNSEDVDSLEASMKSAPKEKNTANSLAAMLEDYKMPSINLDEIFNYCEGSAMFFEKITRDNKKFYSSERMEGEWASNAPAEERQPPRKAPQSLKTPPAPVSGPSPPAQILKPKPPQKFPQNFEKVYTPEDLKSESRVQNMKFSNLVESSNIEVWPTEPPRGQYGVGSNPDYYPPQYQNFEKAKMRQEKPSNPFPNFKDYPPQQEFYNRSYLQNYNEESFDMQSQEMLSSDQLRNPGAAMYGQQPDLNSAKTKIRTKRIMNQDMNEPEDMSSGMQQYPYHMPFVGQQPPKLHPQRPMENSNPYLNSHFERNNMDYQNPMGFKNSNRFKAPEQVDFDQAAKYKNNKPKQPGNMQVSNRGQKNTKVYTKRI